MLQSFVDKRGMRNPNPIVSSSSTYTFRKVVRVLRGQLYNFIDQLYEYLKQFLEFSITGESRFDDKMFIYESLGMILANEKVNPQKRTEIVQKMIKPLLSQMEEIMNKKLYLRDTPQKPTFTTLLSQQIAAIGYLSKGFTGSTKKGSMEIFKQVMNVFIF